MSTRPMPVRFLVKTHRKSRHMRTHHALRHLEENRRVAFASLGPRHRFDSSGIGDKIRFNHPVTIQNSLAAEITLFTGEPVRKRVRVVQHKVFGAKQIENQRRRGDGQQPGLAISLTVEMLIPGVQRDREKAPCLPFEALLWTAALPNRGCAATVKNVDQRLEHMSLRI
jgi:hypothetical protein